MKHFLDARGLSCPLPVVNTKNEIVNMKPGEIVEVLVDNEIAVQNLTKFAKVRSHGVLSEKIAENHYQVVITVGETKGEEGAVEDAAEKLTEEVFDPEECVPCRNKKTAVVLSSNQMGNGAEELGKALMKAFIFALTKQDRLPDVVLLYNSGAFLSCEGSDSLEDLKALEAAGVQISTCGTCLNFYGLTEKLGVGSVTNMYDIVETMYGADQIIRP